MLRLGQAALLLCHFHPTEVPAAPSPQLPGFLPVAPAPSRGDNPWATETERGAARAGRAAGSAGCAQAAAAGQALGPAVLTLKNWGAGVECVESVPRPPRPCTRRALRCKGQLAGGGGVHTRDPGSAPPSRPGQGASGTQRREEPRRRRGIPAQPLVRTRPQGLTRPGDALFLLQVTQARGHAHDSCPIRTTSGR